MALVGSQVGRAWLGLSLPMEMVKKVGRKIVQAHGLL